MTFHRVSTVGVIQNSLYRGAFNGHVGVLLNINYTKGSEGVKLEELLKAGNFSVTFTPQEAEEDDD